MGETDVRTSVMNSSAKMVFFLLFPMTSVTDKLNKNHIANVVDKSDYSTSNRNHNLT